MGLRSCIRIDDPARYGRAGNRNPAGKVGNDVTPPFQRETLAHGVLSVEHAPVELLIKWTQLRPVKFAEDARLRHGKAAGKLPQAAVGALSRLR